MQLKTASPSVGTGALATRGAVALALSLGVNWLLLWAFLTTDVVTAHQALEFAPVTLLTTFGVVGAVLVYALLDRRYADPNPPFVLVALAALVASFVPDVAVYLFDEEATLGVALALMTLHVPPALACVGSLTGKIFPNV